MRTFTASDEIRASGMSVSLDPASASMIEFHRIAEERQCAVIKDQATRIVRQQRTIQRLCLLAWALSVAALLALASDLGWLA